jgi:hypothetical protein
MVPVEERLSERCRAEETVSIDLGSFVQPDVRTSGVPRERSFAVNEICENDDEQ